MEFPAVGTVGFVIALTAFFTTQFNLKGNIALLCAFLVALVFGLAPLVASMFPNASPFVDVILNTVLLTISAAGGYNFIMKVASKINAPSR
jgi:hypothetical protein